MTVCAIYVLPTIELAITRLAESENIELLATNSFSEVASSSSILCAGSKD